MRLSLLIFCAFVIAGCATGPAIDPSALPAAPATYKEGDGRWNQAAPAANQPRGEWWKAFDDPVLDELVARADRENTSIAVAMGRLAQARAFVLSKEADQSVQVDAGANALRAGGIFEGTSGPPRSLFTLGANLSYDLDLFGKLAKATEAAELDAKARERLLRNAHLLVQADVAQVYLALRALDEERALVRNTLLAYRGTLNLTERRYRAGDVAELDVARAQTEVASTESELLALDRRRAELEHALAVLVGTVASDFALPVAEWKTALPVIPAGVPGTVLTRRPDVAAARETMLAAQARVGVAQLAWFPDVTLTGAGGFASSDIGELLKWSARAWGIGALLSLPIFDGGRREAGVQNARGELDVSVARYREQVFVAFKDVEDQLAALRWLADQSEAQARAVASSSRATALSDIRYRNGLVSQLDLLDAQRSEFRNRREALQVRSGQYQATVGLVRALGGGWETPS
jgi:multidrug efflux system outer membrane protein